MGIRVQAHWKELFEKMPEAWGSLFEQAGKIQNRKGKSFTEISISADDGLYTELIGAEVEPGTKAPEGMVYYEVPGQKYMYYRHEGTLQEIANSFGKMYDWAKEQNYTAGEFKIDRGYLTGMPDTPHDLYVKILNHS